MYEHFLRRLAEAGAAGEYFTYRHVIDFMVRMVDPRGRVRAIYDPAFGTCGFLTRALEWIKAKHGGGRTPADGRSGTSCGRRRSGATR
ncbi:MAG: hypothetical protein KatS3mg014_1091 [Actinomycetota bacterium]|nr:MAG: hypothetical protein KatS3mg014_1091 [Actinomycetota bacterium]